MTASVSSPADLANLSLARIGFKGRVGSLLEGSAAAKLILNVYAQTRDAVLEASDWDFAERNISMALLKSAPPGGYVPPNGWTPAYPSPPWFFSYGYPADCLKVRSVQQAPVFVIDMDPQPSSFMVENDNSFTPAQKVILCNVPSAILTYTGQITDLSTWEADAIEAFAAALGRRIAPSLMGLDAAKMAAADEAQSTATGVQEQD